MIQDQTNKLRFKHFEGGKTNQVRGIDGDTRLKLETQVSDTQFHNDSAEINEKK
jgi:hypothetical protein